MAISSLQAQEQDVAPGVVGDVARPAPLAGPGAVAKLARAIGNRALTRIVRGGEAAVLARQERPNAGQVEAWSLAQGQEWGLLDDTRAAVDAAANGSRVTLGGSSPIEVSVDDGVRAAVRTAVRHRMMEILAAWLRPLRDELDATHSASSRLDVQYKMRIQLGPLFRAISAAADTRFEYPAATPGSAMVIGASLFMAELMGEGGAEQALADRDRDPDRAHREAAAAAGLGTGDEWCGAFAFMELKSGGLSLPVSVLGNPLTGTGPPVAGNLDGFFLYLPALEIKIGEDWKPLAAYHSERGSSRRFQVLPAGGAEFDADTRNYEHHAPPRWGQIGSLSELVAAPGDIALIDNAKGTYADHITLVRTYDASNHTLYTIGGNEGDAHPVHGSDAWKLDANPAPTRMPSGAFKGDSSRVYAIAGFSIVDYESHTYRKAGGR